MGNNVNRGIGQPISGRMWTLLAVAIAGSLLLFAAYVMLGSHQAESQQIQNQQPPAKTANDISVNVTSTPIDGGKIPASTNNPVTIASTATASESKLVIIHKFTEQENDNNIQKGIRSRIYSIDNIPQSIIMDQPYIIKNLKVDTVNNVISGDIEGTDGIIYKSLVERIRFELSPEDRSTIVFEELWRTLSLKDQVIQTKSLHFEHPYKFSQGTVYWIKIIEGP